MQQIVSAGDRLMLYENYQIQDDLISPWRAMAKNFQSALS